MRHITPEPFKDVRESAYGMMEGASAIPGEWSSTDILGKRLIVERPMYVPVASALTFVMGVIPDDDVYVLARWLQALPRNLVDAIIVQIDAPFVRAVPCRGVGSMVEDLRRDKPTHVWVTARRAWVPADQAVVKTYAISPDLTLVDDPAQGISLSVDVSIEDDDGYEEEHTVTKYLTDDQVLDLSVRLNELVDAREQRS